MSIILLLAAQAAGQEITTFHPLPSQQEQEHAQQQPSTPSSSSVPQEARPAAKPAEPEKIEVLSVREIPPSANVRFVPPPEEKPEH